MKQVTQPGAVARAARSLVIAGSGLALLSFSAPAVTPGPAPGQDGAAAEAQELNKKPTAAELREEIAEAKEAKVLAAREVGYAETELQIAQLGAKAGEIEVAESLRAARAGLEKARAAQARFEEVERPLQLKEASMKIDDARDSVVKAETDLVGLEQIFEEEAEALAKPEILRRGRRSVERARMRLEIETARHALKVEREFPSKLKELTGEVRAAEAALAAKEAAAAERRLKLELGVTKAIDSVDDKKRALRKAERKIKPLQKRLNGLTGASGKAKAPAESQGAEGGSKGRGPTGETTGGGGGR